MVNSHRFSGHWSLLIGQYALASATILAMTLFLFQMRGHIDTPNTSIFYLLIVLLCAIIAPPGITLFCGLFSFLCYDFFLVPPLFTLQVAAPTQLLDPLAFLCVSIVTCLMAARSRQRAVQTLVYQESDKFRATLLHLISHNLRTPLATVKTSLTSVLTLEGLAPESRQLLVDADEECDQLNRLIGNVLQLSRVDAAAIQLRKEWHAPDDLIGASLRRWHDAIERGTLRITIPEAIPLVQLDFDLISAVLINLVENAFRHGCPPVMVAVAPVPTNRGAEMRFSVQDAGSGVPAAHQTELFKRFSTTSSSGIGLGLAVCKGLVEAHGGRIWGSFEPHQTRFTFALPLTDDPGDTDDSSLDR